MSIIFSDQVLVTQDDNTMGTIRSGQYGFRTPRNIIAFAARAANAAPPQTVVTWAIEEFDRGNNFNPTTGRFTAPVAGRYFFKYSQLLNSADGTSGEYRIVFFVNGVQANRGRTIFYKLNGGSFETVHTDAIFELGPGDYVSVLHASGPAALYFDGDGLYSSFQGYKL